MPCCGNSSLWAVAVSRRRQASSEVVAVLVYTFRRARAPTSLHEPRNRAQGPILIKRLRRGPLLRVAWQATVSHTARYDPAYKNSSWQIAQPDIFPPRRRPARIRRHGDRVVRTRCRVFGQLYLCACVRSFRRSSVIDYPGQEISGAAPRRAVRGARESPVDAESTRGLLRKRMRRDTLRRLHGRLDSGSG
ncbi:hypothetical protein MRX96_037350 [Rhipicephalus microplus]